MALDCKNPDRVRDVPLDLDEEGLQGIPKVRKSRSDRKLKDPALNPRGRGRWALRRSEATGALRQEGMGGRQPIHCVSSSWDVLGTSEHLDVDHSPGGWQDREPGDCECMDGDAPHGLG